MKSGISDELGVRTEEDFALKPLTYSESETWDDIQDLLDGQSLKVCQKHLFRVFHEAMAEGSMNVDHAPLFDFVLDQVAAALALKPEIKPAKGSDELAALWRSWWVSKALQRADRLRCGSGVAVLHCRLVDKKETREIVDLEVLRGDQVEVEPDEYSPMDWSRVKSVTIAGHPAKVTYTRQDDGSYLGTSKTDDEVTELGIWDACPVTAWYFRPASTLLPPPNSTLRDAHVMASRHLTKAGHDYIYHLNQPWAKNLPKAGRRIRFGTNVLLDLGDEGSVGSLQTVDTYGPGIDGLVKALKLVTRLYGLPPEFLDTTNRSETGAARSHDDRPLTDLQRVRRVAVEQDVAQTQEQWAPLLPAGSIVFSCTAPPPPVPVDMAQEMAGLKAAMQMGQTTAAVYLSRHLQVPVPEAQRLVDEALARNRREFPELFVQLLGAGNGGQNQTTN